MFFSLNLFKRVGVKMKRNMARADIKITYSDWITRGEAASFLKCRMLRVYELASSGVIRSIIVGQVRLFWWPDIYRFGCGKQDKNKSDRNNKKRRSV